MLFILKILLGGTLLLIAHTVTPAAENSHGGAVGQGKDSISQTPSLPTLNLNTAQREQVRQALLTKHTEVEFRLKATKPAKDFTPKIGANLPSVTPDGLPSELIQKIPQLADYGYAKMKDQILIVNGLDRKIAEIIPETQPQTTGQK